MRGKNEKKKNTHMKLRNVIILSLVPITYTESNGQEVLNEFAECWPIKVKATKIITKYNACIHYKKRYACRKKMDDGGGNEIKFI
jgi:hypothetical protein